MPCAPVPVPWPWVAVSTPDHACCSELSASAAALRTAANRLSSIFSMSVSAFFSCVSRTLTPCSTICCSASRFACTAFSSAVSMPATALLSRASTSGAGSLLLAAPADAALVTVFSTCLMLARVSSRPCSAFSVASATAWRIASPCWAVACENWLISAS